MTLTEIKAAVEAGKKVHWGNSSYTVIKDTFGRFLVQCTNGHVAGLTWKDGETMEYEEADFFIASEEGPHA